MTAVRALVQRWREEAEILRRCGADEAAATTEARALDLEEALRADADAVVGLAEARFISGYSKRRLREFVSEGVIPNVGRKGKPLFRRCDLPRKPGPRCQRDTFDPDAEALEILSDRRAG